MQIPVKFLTTLLVYLISLPSCIGIIRYYFLVSFDFAALISIATISVLAVFYLIKYAGIVRSPIHLKYCAVENQQYIVHTLAVVASGLFIYLRLSADSFNHLPIVGTEGGGDSGNHVMLAESFRLSNPKEYEGQNLFYVLIGLFKSENSRNFHSAFWRSTFLLWSITFALFTLSWYKVVNKIHLSPKFLLAGGLGLSIAFAISDRAILPYFHYFQIDGFYSSIAGMGILACGIGGYTLFNNSNLRLVTLILSTIMLRHAYALNVGEFLAACCILCWAESIRINNWLNWASKVTALFFLLAALLVYSKLYPLLSIYGGFTKWKAHNALPLEALFVALACFELWNFKPTNRLSDHAYPRFLLFTGAFVGCGLLIQLAIYSFDLPQRYYFYKHAIPLFIVSGVGLIGILLRRLSELLVAPETKENRFQRNVSLSLLLGALFAAWTTSRIYNATYTVRRLDCTNGCHELSPLHFPEIQRDIEQVLESRNKKFGGILHTHWPFFNFLTASLGRHVALWNEQSTYFSGSLAREEGYCVFWAETQREKERMVAFTRDQTYTEEKKNRLAIYETLLSSQIKECAPESGKGYWKNKLCWECR